MFQKIQKKIKEFLKEKGQGVVEYVLILGVVALIATALLVNGGMADKVVKSANTMGNAVDSQANLVTAAVPAVSTPDGTT